MLGRFRTARTLTSLVGNNVAKSPSQNTRPQVPMDIVLDFDGTITVKDTIEELAQAAVRLQRSKSLKREDTCGGRGDQEKEDPGKVWRGVVDAYLADCDASRRSGPYPGGEGRSTLELEVRHLRRAREIEMRSLERVARSGLFAGITELALESAGRKAVETRAVRFRTGLDGLLAEVTRREDWRLAVLSVNFSGAWIRGVLSTVGVGGPWRIISNETDLDGGIRGPDGGRVLASGEDKAEALRGIVAGREMEVIYVGDSTTDLECLLFGRGVIMSCDGESSLLRTLRGFGHVVPRLCHASPGWKLAWAADFAEIIEGLVKQEDNNVQV